MKYQSEFPKIKDEEEKYMFKTILEEINKIGKPLEDWNNKDLDKFLTNLNSISINSLNKSLHQLRQYHKFVCEKKDVEYKQLTPTKNMIDYLNLDKLLSVTLTLQHYQAIKNQLTVISEKDGNEYNYRNKVLFMLAWEGLSKGEIQNLKIEDIEFVSKDMVKIHLPSRIVTIASTTIDGIRDDIVGDIKKVINEKFYLRQEERGKEMLVPYRDTPYLIRPVAMRVSTKNEQVSNPSLVLQKAFKHVICPGIDLEHLSISDIRRSKMIYLLSMENVRPAEIQELWDKKTDGDLFWLKQVSDLIYKKKRR